MKHIFFIIFAFLEPLISYANTTIGGEIVRPAKTINFTSTSSIITDIIAYAIGIAGILGVIGITWGGITMIMAVGEDEKMKKGRYIVIYSIVGVILAGLAYSIVKIIGNLRI